MVCDPRRNALLLEGNQNDRVDAWKLAELLHNNQLRSAYHGDHGPRTLKELVRSLSRVMTRVRSWVMVSAFRFYSGEDDSESPSPISDSGVRGVSSSHLRFGVRYVRICG